MDIEIKYGPHCKDDAFYVREKVFMDEQGYTDEFDDIDDQAIHFALYKANQPIGCARAYVDPADGTRYIVGRVAVLPKFRKGGYGQLLVRECENAIREKGGHEVRLHAQEYVEGWYSAMGFERFGEVDYEDEGQPHIWMKKVL